MSAGLSTFGSAQWIQTLFGLATPPTSYFLALATSEPGKGWTGDVLESVEPNAPEYVRQEIPNDTDHWTQDNNYITNAQPINFGAPERDWGVITHYALCTTQGGGEIYLYSSFVRPLRLTTDYLVSVPTGAINIALDTFGGSYNV